MEQVVISERVDCIPLLLNTIIKMGIPEIVDQTIPIHKNWTGLSPGYTMAVWLTHLLYNGEQPNKGRESPLPPLLRTVRDTFASYGSSISQPDYRAAVGKE